MISKDFQMGIAIIVVQAGLFFQRKFITTKN